MANEFILKHNRKRKSSTVIHTLSLWITLRHLTEYYWIHFAHFEYKIISKHIIRVVRNMYDNFKIHEMCIRDRY